MPSSSCSAMAPHVEVAQTLDACASEFGGHGQPRPVLDILLGMDFRDVHNPDKGFFFRLLDENPWIPEQLGQDGAGETRAAMAARQRCVCLLAERASR